MENILYGKRALPLSGGVFLKGNISLNFSVIVRFGIENGKKPRLPSGIMCTFVVGKTGL